MLERGSTLSYFRCSSTSHRGSSRIGRTFCSETYIKCCDRHRNLSFQPVTKRKINFSHHLHQSKRSILVLYAAESSFNDDDDDQKQQTRQKKEDEVANSCTDFQNFNPLTSNRLNNNFPSSSSKKGAAAATTISLRQLQMKEITSNLLALAGGDSKDQIKKLLEENREFLLEPLEESSAVLEADSIYKPNMDRSERYNVYRQSMEERIEKANIASVRQVLISLKDYVLQFQ